MSSMGCGVTVLEISFSQENNYSLTGDMPLQFGDLLGPVLVSSGPAQWD